MPRMYRSPILVCAQAYCASVIVGIFLSISPVVTAHAQSSGPGDTLGDDGGISSGSAQAFPDRLGGFDITQTGDVAATNLVNGFETGFLASNAAPGVPLVLSTGDSYYTRSTARSLKDLTLAAGGVCGGDPSAAFTPYGRLWVSASRNPMPLNYLGAPVGSYGRVNKINPAGVYVGAFDDPSGVGGLLAVVGTASGSFSFPVYGANAVARGINRDLSGAAAPKSYVVGSAQTGTDGITGLPTDGAFACRLTFSDSAASCPVRATPEPLPVNALFGDSDDPDSYDDIPVPTQAQRLTAVSDRYSCKSAVAVGYADLLANYCTLSHDRPCVARRAAFACPIADRENGQAGCASTPVVLTQPWFAYGAFPSNPAEGYAARGISPDGTKIVGEACQAQAVNQPVTDATCGSNASVVRGVLWDVRSGLNAEPTIFEDVPDRDPNLPHWRIASLNAVNNSGVMVGFGKRGSMYFAVKVTPTTPPANFSCPTAPAMNFVLYGNDYCPQCVKKYIDAAYDSIGRTRFEAERPTRQLALEFQPAFLAYEAIVLASRELGNDIALSANYMGLLDLSGNIARDLQKRLLYRAMISLGISARDMDAAVARWDALSNGSPTPPSVWTLVYSMVPTALRKTCG